MSKFLKTNEQLQSKEDLKKYLEKFASDNILTKNSSSETFPILRLEDNVTYIYLVYTLLNDHIKLEIPIHPAGEWLLDNYYIIEKTAKIIKKELTLKEYKNLPGLLDDGFARIYLLANEIVSCTDGKITKDDLIEYLNAYQVNKELTMKEIWKINMFLQISLIEKIREICEKIFIAQSQKWKVENSVERLIENKNIEKIDIPISGEYQYIEYMSYKLRNMGSKANIYEEVFEEQVEKSGTTIEKAINREHFDIALKTLSMKNAITSIKNLLRIDTVSIFEQVNVVEKILNNDPANVYKKMDYSSKAYYRSQLLEIANETKISEIFVANKIIELCKRNLYDENPNNELQNLTIYDENPNNELQNLTIYNENSNNELQNLTIYNKKFNIYEANDGYKKTKNIINNHNETSKIETIKKSHVGYYLIDNGRDELLTEISNKKVKTKTSDEKAKVYITIQVIFTLILTSLISLKLKALALFLVIPIMNMFNQIANYILSKIVKPKLIPKIDLEDGIPENLKTVCVIPVMLNGVSKVDEIFNKLEVYYLANKSENLYFTLLGDCKESTLENTKQDELIVSEGIKKAKELNKKYGEKFFFIYRKRIWSSSEQKFIGWERKRGAITEFNSFLMNNKNNFLANTCNDFFIKNRVKYVITLDEDTNLILDSAKKLVGTMAHILNRPEINKIKDRVDKGYSIIQPRIEIDMDDARKNKFTCIFTESQGLDIYTNTISNFYQDNFNEGIYTGKGIYDVEVFNKILKDQIPENKVLSHDLLEGNFLRAGYASDIELIDSIPSNYISYKKRKHRWIRGDMQILSWVKSNLNLLSKYKILDNVIRNFNEIFVMISLILSFIFQNSCLGYLAILIYSFPSILKLINNISFKNVEIRRTKTFAKKYSNIQMIFLKFWISLITLFDVAFLEIDAISKSIYRMTISHQKLLEWTTSNEAESKKENLLSYYESMKYQIFTALILLLIVLPFNFKTQFLLLQNSRQNLLNMIFYKMPINQLVFILLEIIFIIMLIIAPIVMYKLCENVKKKRKINKKEETELLNTAKLTWKFFKENMVNYLPIDNFQEDRKEKKAYHTSPTNIGFLLMAAISSYDLKFENREDTINLIKNIISSVEKLEKWNGHLYNWYDVKTMKPIIPLDVSSVDSGNFVGYLITTKEFLIEQNVDKNLINEINNLILKTDFSKLYDKDMGLFSIGFSVSQNKLYDSYYDLLASEARQASIIAIAKKDVPSKHWKNLGRTLTKIDDYKGLVSWGGTAFEYLMPNINIRSYDLSLLDESCKLLILSQQKYSKRLNIPWGMSEASFGQKDFKGNYQYKTFGIPWLGLKRGLADDAVISPYSTFLSLQYENKNAFDNIKRLKQEGAFGVYGFYDAIDYKPKKKVIKTYMAHHQGMIIASINNFLNNNIFQKRFMNDASIQGIKILLEEKVPENVIIKEKQDKVRKINYKEYEEGKKRNTGANVISTSNLSNITTSAGKTLTKFNDVLINNSQKTYIKNVEPNKIYELESKESKYEFLPYKSKIITEDGNLKIEKEITIAPLTQVEVEKIKIQNKELQDINIEITQVEDIILSTRNQYESHKTFDKMFIRFKFDNNILTATRKRRNETEPIVYEKIAFVGENNNFDFELSKENFVSRKKEQIPEAIMSSKILSNKIETEINPIVAIRKNINIKKGKSSTVYIIRSVDIDEKKAEEYLMEYLNIEKLNRVFELSKEQTDAENRYMNLSNKELETYQNLVDELFITNKDESELKSNFLNNSKNDSESDFIDNLKAVSKSNSKINSKLNLKLEPKLNYKSDVRLDFNLNLSNNNLWKYGISGDYDIICVKVKDYNDIEILKNALNAYKYLHEKNIDVELVILTNVEINGIIVDEKLEHMLNKRKGIFVIKNIPQNDKKIILACSKIIIN